MELTEKQKLDYLDAITRDIWSKPYTSLTLKEKHVLDVNLFARHLSTELTISEFNQLVSKNVKY
jgi:hypothetical protein